MATRDPAKIAAARARAAARYRAERATYPPEPPPGLLAERPLPSALDPWGEWEWIDSGRRMRHD